MYKRTHKGRFLVTELNRGAGGRDGPYEKRRLLGEPSSSSGGGSDASFAAAPKKMRTKIQVR